MTDSFWNTSPDGDDDDSTNAPKGQCDAINGAETLSDGRAVLKVRVRAVPHEGAANKALVRLLARTLDISLRNIEITRGATSRIKPVKLVGNAAFGPALEKLARTR